VSPEGEFSETVGAADELRNSDSFDGFKRFMKTILFSVTSALEVIL